MIAAAKVQDRLARHPVLTAVAVVAAMILLVSYNYADRQFVINTSPSIQRGLYVRAAAVPAVGTLVEFRLPPEAWAYIRSRVGGGRSIADWYLLKPVVAGPGDWVDSTGEKLLVNGRLLGPMPPLRDAAGRPLPRWQASRRLGSGEFFTFSSRIPNSFDSRCFGPVRLAQVTAVRRLAWGW